MRTTAIVLAALLTNGCVRPGLTTTSGGATDTAATCNTPEPCGSGRGDRDLVLAIVLGTAVVGGLAIAMHRYVTADDH